MAYTIPEIITWSKICQPLAAIGEAKKNISDKTRNVDLHIELYNTRKDVEYEYSQDQSSSNLFSMGNYLLSLCGTYIFQAQQTNVGGGSITPITPGLLPDPYDFVVTATSFIAIGDTTKVFPASWKGLNILFVRNAFTQSLVNDGISTCYSWDKITATFGLINGAAFSTEIFQIYPIL